MSKLKFRQGALSNGLTVIGEERSGAQSTALGFFVKTGARDESAVLSGVSHFLEHMLFKGTAKRSALDITYDLAAIGAQANAFTSVETTVYYAAVLPEYLDDIFDILSDMMRPALDAIEFSTEKKVILEEIALYQDRPSHVLFEEALKQFYNTNKAGNSVLGSTESISALSVEQMREYFGQRYSPKNMILTVTGSFKWEKILELAEKHCGHWTGEAVTRDYAAHSATPKRIEKKKDGIQTCYASFITSGPAVQDSERYAMDVLACMLGDSSGSKIFWQLVDKGLCDSASIDAEQMDRTGMVYSYASCAQENLSEVESIMRAILADPLNFSAEDLERAKTKIRTHLVLQGESSMRRLTAVGFEWLYENTFTPLEEEVKKYALVTRESIEIALKKFPLAPLTEVVLEPSAA